MALATLTQKGQVTIPKSIRDSLGLQTGDKIEFVLGEDSTVTVKPVTRRVDDVFGCLHRAGREAVSIAAMDNGIKHKLRETFK